MSLGKSVCVHIYIFLKNYVILLRSCNFTNYGDSLST